MNCAPATTSRGLAALLLKPAVIAVGVGLITFVVFLGALRGDFVAFDDGINVCQNRRIQSLTAENIVWMFRDTDQAMRYKPLNWLAWALIHQAYRLDPFGYHLANLLFHSANAVLFYFVLVLLVDLGAKARSAAIQQSRMNLCCAAGALFWSLHPLRVEPVAWVTGLPYGESLFFALIALGCYLKFAASPPPKRRRWYVGAVLSFTVALLAYPIVIGLVVVLCVLDWFPLKRLEFGQHFRDIRWSKGLWLEKIPFLAVALVFVCLNLLGRFNPGRTWRKAVSLDEFGFVSRAMQSFYVWANYLVKQIWPGDLSPFYSELMNFHPGEPIFLASAGLVLAATWFCFKQRFRWPALLALWVSYLALLVPVLGWTEHPHFASDRYGTVATMCWSIPCALALYWGTNVRARLATAMGTFLLAACAGASMAQIRIWRDSESLFTSITRREGNSPYAGDAYVMLGTFYSQKADYVRACESFQRATQIQPVPVKAFGLLGACLARLHQNREAIDAYRQALRSEPEKPGYHFQLVHLLAAEGKAAEAEVHYAEFARINPGPQAAAARAGLLWALASSYATKGNATREAIRASERALEQARASGAQELIRELEVRCAEYKRNLAAADVSAQP